MSEFDEWLKMRYPPELIKAGDRYMRARERVGARMMGLPVDGWLTVDANSVIRQKTCPFFVDTRLAPCR